MVLSKFRYLQNGFFGIVFSLIMPQHLTIFSICCEALPVHPFYKAKTGIAAQVFWKNQGNIYGRRNSQLFQIASNLWCLGPCINGGNIQAICWKGSSGTRTWNRNRRCLTHGRNEKIFDNSVVKPNMAIVLIDMRTQDFLDLLAKSITHRPFTQSELRKLIAETWHTRSRFSCDDIFQILSGRFAFQGEKKTLQNLAKEFGVTKERIRQIESKALRLIIIKLRKTAKQ